MTTERIPKATRAAMEKYAGECRVSSTRAQCYMIASYYLENETIAQRIARDHNDSDSHLRIARIMVMAGCATELVGKNNCYGVFTFEDGSTF